MHEAKAVEAVGEESQTVGVVKVPCFYDPEVGDRVYLRQVGSLMAGACILYVNTPQIATRKGDVTLFVDRKNLLGQISLLDLI